MNPKKKTIIMNRQTRRYGGSWKMINGDILKVDIKNGSVQLIVTSPPYNLNIQYDCYDDNKSYSEYLQFITEVLERLFALLESTGRLILNVPFHISTGISLPIYADIIAIAKQIGFTYKNTIVWSKQNAATRTAWGSWCSASAPNIIMTEEALIVLHKGNWKRSCRGESTISRDEFLEYSLSPWHVNGETKKGPHPVPFPYAIPYRAIQLYSYRGDTVLDPFAGRGTTIKAAIDLGRHGIGVELSEKYCQYAAEYIEVDQHKKAA